VPLATKVFAAGGGKYLARGGKIAAISGEPPKPRAVVERFDSASGRAGPSRAMRKRQDL
jgi:uncharacterized protein (DUF1330 family)